MNFANIRKVTDIKNQLLAGLLTLSLFVQPLMVFADEVGVVDTNFLFNSERVNNYGDFKSTVSSGDYNVNIPIEVPVGVKGHTPDISINYNSTAFRSATPYGFGWSDSIPYIKRNNTIGSDKIYATSTVFYSSLHGDLVEISPNEFIPKETGANGITKYNLLPSGQWEAKTVDGQKITFGDTTNSKVYRATSTTDILSWGVTKWEDNNSNLISYSYIQQDGTTYIDEIKYGFYSANDNAYTLKWTYETRPDVMPNHSNGFLQNLDKRVSKIELLYSSNVIKRYDFQYHPHLVTSPTSKISEISITSKPGLPDEYTLGSHKFEYRDNSNISFVRDTENSYFQYHPDEYWTILDLNNNGLQDRISYASNNNSGEFLIIEGQSYTPEDLGIVMNSSSSVNSRASFVDLNGDGWVDFYKGNSYYQKIWESDRDNTFTQAASSLDDDYTVSQEPFLELNGDGLLDKYINGILYTNNGGGYTSTGLSRDDAGLAPSSHSSVDDFLWTDLNGDGITDVIGQDSSSGPDDDGIWRGNGDGTFTKITSGIGGIYLNGFSKLSPKRGQFLDFNGDGLLDFIMNKTASEPYPGTFEDGGQIFINQGDFTWVSIGQAAGKGIPNQQVRDLTFSDYNHDGAVDVKLHDVGNAENGFYINNSTAPLLYEAEFISGKKEIVEYVHVSLQGEDNHIGTKYVVSKKTLEDGFGNDEEMEYEYSGGEIYFENYRNRKPAGFEIIKEIHKGKGSVSTTYFHQGDGANPELNEPADSYGKIGKPYKTIVSDLLSGDVLEENYYGWIDQTNTHGQTSTFLSLENTRVFDRNDYKDALVSYIHDLTHGGNVSTTQHGEVLFNDSSWGYTGIDESDDKITEISYASGNDMYLPSIVTQKDFEDNAVSIQRAYYDDLPLGQISFGNQTKSSVWLDTDNSWIDNVVEYDLYGLVTKQTDSLGNEVNYINSFNKLYPTSVTNDLGQTIQNEYDYISGQVNKTTDPNGNISQSIFDGFGRLVEEKKTTPSGSLVTSKIVSYNDASLPRAIYSTDFATPNGLDTYTYIDGLGRPMQIKRETPNGNFSVKTFDYGKEGRLLSETLPYTSSTSGYDSSVPSSVKETSYKYDGKDRVKQKTDPMGTDLTKYKIWDTVINNKRAYSKTYTSDSFGNLAYITEQLSTLGATSTEPILDAYQYKQKISLSGVVGAGADYQVLLKVGRTNVTNNVDLRLNDNALHFPVTRNDGGDLQFYADDEITELPFWVEKVDGDIAYVWVKVLDNLDTDKDIYIYYGHRKPTNFSDGDETFTFFDEFEGSTLDNSKWTKTDADITVSSGFAEVVNNTPTEDGALTSNSNFGPNTAISYVGYIPEATSSEVYTGYQEAKFLSDTNLGYTSGVRTTGDNGSGDWELISPDFTNSYHKFEIIRPDHNNTTYVLDDEVKTTQNDYFLNGKPFKANQRRPEWRTGNIKLDWVAARKYVLNGPEVISVQSEEDIASVHKKYKLFASTEGVEETPEEIEEEIIQFEEEIKEVEISRDSPAVSNEQNKTEETPEEIEVEVDTPTEDTEELTQEEVSADSQQSEASIEEIIKEEIAEGEVANPATQPEDNTETDNQETGSTSTSTENIEILDNQEDEEGPEVIPESEDMGENQEEIVLDTNDETATSTTAISTSEAVFEGENVGETEILKEVFEVATTTKSEETGLIGPEESNDEFSTSTAETQEFGDEEYADSEHTGEPVVINQSIKLQKPAKSYTHKEKIWLLDGKISLKESRFLNLKNRILKKRQALANIDSAIKKKEDRISSIQQKIDAKELKGKDLKEQKEKIKENKDKFKKLKSKKDKVIKKISDLKEKKSKIKQKVKDQKEKRGVSLSQKVNELFGKISEKLSSSLTINKAHASTWADETYGFRKEITISGGSNSDVGQQVLLKIGKNSFVSDEDFHLDGKAEFFPLTKDDGGDLNFYASDDLTILPFWVEKVEGDVAWVWVKTVEDPTLDQVLNLYYGNTGPVNYSDGVSTFEVFQDFGTMPIDSSNWSLNGSHIINGDEIEFTHETILSGSGNNTNYTPGMSIHFKGSLPSNNRYHYGSRGGLGSLSFASKRNHLGGTLVGLSYINGSPSYANSVHDFEVAYLPSLTKEFYLDGNIFRTSNSALQSTASLNPTFYQKRKGKDSNLIIDYIFTRKNAVNEVSFVSAGDEETMGSGNSSETVVEEIDGYVYSYYEYDQQDNLIKIEDADGNEREFVYDSLGRQISSELPHVPGETAATHSYTYDSVGNKTSETRPDGSVINYAYDDLNRLLTVNNPANPGTEVVYTYDTATNGIGMLATITGPNYSKSYTYDKAGNMISESVTVGGNTHTTSYVYSDYGLLESTTYPDGTVIANAYNIDGSIDSVSKDSANLVSFNYNHLGQITDKDYANGIEEDYVYNEDTLFRLESKTVSGATTTLEDISYTYDEIGNVASIENTPSEQGSTGQAGTVPYTKLYSYDSLERLQTATTTINGTTTEDVYTYSNSGNILSHNNGLYEYGNTTFPQAATSYKGNTYSYDSNGNLSARNNGAATTTYSYDWNDRLSNVSDGSGTIATYNYTDARQRISKVVGTSTKYYIGETTEIENGDYTNYAFAGSSRIATIDNIGDVTYNHSDHLGSGSLETNNVGAVTSALTYTPYGSEESSTGAKSNDHTYTDQERDVETGLMYYNARYYDTDLKRFTSVDVWGGELENPQTQNKYSYVMNNPMKHTDPTGNCYAGGCDDGLKDGLKNLPGNLVDTAKFAGSQLYNGIAQAWSSDAAQQFDQNNQQVADGLHQYVSDWGDYFDGTMSQNEREKFVTSQVPGGILGIFTGQLTKSSFSSQKLPEYTLSHHAEHVRMPQRGISRTQLENTMKSESFDYFHDGQTKRGYFDPQSRIFAGQSKQNNVITTVIDNVSDGYINNLKESINNR